MSTAESSGDQPKGRGSVSVPRGITVSLVTICGVCVAAAFSVMTYTKSDLKDDFYAKVDGEVLRTRLEAEIKLNDERRAQSSGESRQIAEQVDRLASQVTAIQVENGRLAENGINLAKIVQDLQKRALEARPQSRPDDK